MNRNCLQIALCLSFTVTTIACNRPNETPEGAARAFIDRYFVELDQRAALDLTEGVAHAKLKEEIRILGDDTPSADAERPRIYYRQVSRSEQPDGVALRFRLTVMVPGDITMEPEVLLRLRAADRGWRVTNFEMMPLAKAPAEL